MVSVLKRIILLLIHFELQRVNIEIQLVHSQAYTQAVLLSASE